MGILEWARIQVRASTYKMSSHADEECQIEKVHIRDIEEAILNGEIIEDYEGRQDSRGHACLISGKTRDGNPLHVVVAKTRNDRLRVCTVYRPSENYFKEARYRRPKL